MERTEVVVIGAGSTGSAVVRDLALRGVEVILLERGDLCSGTTGKCHGMLHSGARYAVKDKESAKECIRENKILQKIAPHVLERTGGLFIGFEEYGKKWPDYKDKKIQGCKECGIPVEEITPKEALEIEPNLNPEIASALYIPDDGAVHVFQFVISMCLDAKKNGASIRPYNEVIGFLEEGNTVRGVRVKDHIKNRIYDIEAEIVINAGGPWAAEIAKMAGVDIPLTPSPGVMVVINRRVVNRVINQLRPTADGDIIVPHHTTAIIGTTEWEVEDPDTLTTPKDHIELMIKEGTKMSPIVKQCRLIRAYSAARPLIGEMGIAPGRELSRTFKAFDHESLHNLEGFLTITGGKMCTARGMAEAVVDLACEKLGVRAKCTTHKEPLPGSEEEVDVMKLAEEYNLVKIYAQRIVDRLGTQAREALEPIKKEPFRGCWICMDEFVTRAEIEYAVKHQWAYFMYDIRRRTRQGMGTCQGGTCSHVLAGIMVEEFGRDPVDVHADLMSALKLRWIGDRFLLWGDHLRQFKLNEAIYSCLANYDKLGRELPFSMPVFGELPWKRKI